MYKVLIVDDEDIIRKGIEAMLPLAEFHLQITGTCSNAFDALENMVDERPDILICDIKMPQMNGLELIEKAMQLYPQLQPIILSGYDDFEFARAAMKYGVKEYLLKPCEKEELTEAIRRICEVLDHQRKISDEKDDGRNSTVEEVMLRLAEIGRQLADEKMVYRDVKQLIDMVHKEVLTEALVCLVVMTENLLDAQQQIDLLKRLYQKREQHLIEYTVQVLKQLYLRGKKRAFVEQMCQYVQENYMNSQLSLQHIADHVVHMNASYIGKEFGSDLGMRFSQYLVEVRIHHAKRLIREQLQMPFYEIAEQVGYGDNPQYFSLMFKRVTKVTPKEFRNKIVSGKNTNN